MNRRRFLSLLAGAGGLIASPAKWALAEKQPDTPITAKELDYPGAIKAFVERKQKAGYPDLFLFKNRGGQWIYALYDVETGNPTATETFYLLYGKPKDDGRFVLQRAGEPFVICGCHAIGVEYQPFHTPSELNAKLNAAFYSLTHARWTGLDGRWGSLKSSSPGSSVGRAANS